MAFSDRIRSSRGLAVTIGALRCRPARLPHRALCLLAGLLVFHLNTAAGETAGAAGTPPRRVVSIAEARALPAGTEVTVEGSITSPPGAFKSSKLDDGFALQDRSGGIYVRVRGSRRW